ncbi:MAG TPA: hypothetical protein DCL61_06395 [Cyanobacteria bacterium UBA12227]|nr:hypothetical protein [Cyanobacteria bacterium UBA12227]
MVHTKSGFGQQVRRRVKCLQTTMQRRVSAIALLSLFLIAAVLPPTLASTVTENRLTHTKLQFLVKRSFSPHPPIPPSPHTQCVTTWGKD